MRRSMILGVSVAAFLMPGLSSSRAADAMAVSSADKDFVAKVSQGGMFEVEASKIVKDKASRQDIADTGVTEVHDHELVGAKLKSIADSAGLPFPAELNAEFQGRLDKLKALSGPAFDAAYIKEMEVIHAADGAAFAMEAKSGHDQALRDFAAETVLIVRRHIGSLHAVPPPGAK